MRKGARGALGRPMVVACVWAKNVAADGKRRRRVLVLWVVHVAPRRAIA
jgi:hypothetical protein